MSCRAGVVGLAVGVLLLGAVPRAGAQSDLELLQRFERQNQAAAIKLKQQIDTSVTEALVIGAQEPERAAELLRRGRELLAEANGLPRAERTALARRLDDAFREAKARLDSKQAALRLAAQASQPPPAAPTAAAARTAPRGQTTPGPNLIAVPQAASMTVTPVVSPDRRWVRIGVSGGFFVVR